jgi:hypothetical protein
LVAIKNDINDGRLFHLDLSDPSLYSVSCYNQLSSKWKVQNDVCTLETKSILLPGSYSNSLLIDIPFSIKLRGSGDLENNDVALIMYSENNSSWKTLDSIPGSLISADVSDYNYLIKKVLSGSSLKIRIIFCCNDNDEYISLICANRKDLCLGSPFLSGTISPFVWSASPVSIENFIGKIVNNMIHISWITISEYNNNMFVLEKSSNGIDFESIKVIKGQKYSNTDIKYEVTDVFHNKEDLIYRLKYESSNGSTVIYDFISFLDYDVNERYKSVVTPDPCIGKCVVNLNNIDSVNQMIAYSTIDALGNISYSSISLSDTEVSHFIYDSGNKFKPGLFIVRE